MYLKKNKKSRNAIISMLIASFVFVLGHTNSFAVSNIAPSILPTEVVDNLVGFKINYPQNATTKRLQLYNTSTNTWTIKENVQDGTHYFNELTPNTVYKGVLSWHDGIAWHDMYKEIKTFTTTASESLISNSYTTEDSISFHIEFPSNAYNKKLSLKRGSTLIAEKTFLSSQHANGIFTFSNLQPDVEYTGVLSWTEYGTLKTKQMNIRTLASESSTNGFPSITCKSIGTNSIEVDFSYPNSSNYGNRLQLYNYSTGEYQQASPDLHMANGTHKFNNLSNNTKYKVYISWNDGSWQDLSLDVMTGSKVYRTVVLNIDPVIKDNNNELMKVSQKWNWWPDYRNTLNKFKTYISEASGGKVNFNIVTTRELNAFPQPNNMDLVNYVSRDGYYNNVKNYPNLQCDVFNNGRVNYSKLVDDLDLESYINHNEIDFVLPFYPPGTGFYEEIMAGPTSWQVNWANPLTSDQCSVNRNVLFLSHGRDRDQALLLHVFSHYVETTMNQKASANWPKTRTTLVREPSNGSLFETNLNDWQYFTLTDWYNYGEQGIYNTIYAAPGNSQIGTTHFPANGDNYGYDNPNYVESGCEDWYNYPNIGISKTSINSSTWENVYPQDTAEGAYLRWWFNHIPKNNGSHVVNGVTINNNWWPYFMDIN